MWSGDTNFKDYSSTGNHHLNSKPKTIDSVGESQSRLNSPDHQIIKSKVRSNRMNLIYDALLPLVLSGRREEKKGVFLKTGT